MFVTDAVVQRILRSALGFLVSAVVIAAGIALASRLPPRHQLTVMAIGFLVGGAIAGAWLTSIAFGSFRVASTVCSAAAVALGGMWFVLLAPAEGKRTELLLAAGAGWAAAGLLMGLGFTRWDRNAWLLLIGPLVFGLSGVASRLAFDLVQDPLLALVTASLVATAFGGALFSTAAMLLN
jgi:hypothetical protein